MQIGYIVMIPLLGILAIIQTVVAPRLAILEVRPDLVLLAVLAWTLFNGGYSGIVWAFVGGLWMDVLSGGPMGASSLALMAAALVAGVGHNRLFRSNPVTLLVAVVVGSLVYAFSYLGILIAIGRRVDLLETSLQLVFPATAYNTVLMLVLSPVLYRRLDRRELDSV
ncbi:MAG: rod shape-determining protein MreD [Caldilineaceae bacterium]|nr:rod shape-determining protein MreD [Caldilineaceae bacterium]